MVLSDRTIKEELAKGRIVIEPFDLENIQPASVDVHLGRDILIFRRERRGYVDVRCKPDDLTELVQISNETPFMLYPGEFVLGTLLERITLSDDLMARIEGKSSLARFGLLIHSTAGFVDPGWSGYLTLELSNILNMPITLYYGMKIGHISFTRLTTPADNPYGSPKLRSKYQGQTGPLPSRYYLDYPEPELPLFRGLADTPRSLGREDGEISNG